MYKKKQEGQCVWSGKLVRRQWEGMESVRKVRTIARKALATMRKTSDFILSEMKNHKRISINKNLHPEVQLC